MRLPRGYRNRNPGNIKHFPGNDWHGQSGVDSGGFVIFDNDADGIDAIGEIIDSKKRRGLLSIRDIIADYAPHSENDVGAYIDTVTQKTGWPMSYVPVREEGDYVALVQAIIKQENGYSIYSDSFVANSLSRPT